MHSVRLEPTKLISIGTQAILSHRGRRPPELKSHVPGSVYEFEAHRVGLFLLCKKMVCQKRLHSVCAHFGASCRGNKLLNYYRDKNGGANRRLIFFAIIIKQFLVNSGRVVGTHQAI